MAQLTAGATAPDFTLPTADGEFYRLQTGLESGPLILVFFKSACPTCHLALPYVQTLDAHYGNERIWGISQDDVKETLDFMQYFKLKFKTLIDEHPYPVSGDYGLEYVPGIFIVDRDGSIRVSDYGFSKDALNECGRVLAEESKVEPISLFGPDDKLPPRRPGCRSKN